MRQISTNTLSNQNIATAFNAATYTADADRWLVVRLFADQVAGNGAYSAYITIQRLGTGSAYEVQPRTTATVASGVTAIAFVTIPFPVKNTDVVKVYILGLAGDTTTPDITVGIWEDDGLRPTTADRTLDVSSGGEAGVDWANVGSPSTSVSLSSTTVGTVTTTTTATNVTTVNGLASGVITATSIAADAITAAKIADGAIDAATFAAGAINAAAIAADAITDAKVASDVTIASVTGAVGSVTGNVGGNVVGSVGSVTTVSDKTGYSLSTAGIQAIWDRAVSNLTTVSSIGKLIVDNLNATISSVYNRLGAPTSADLATDIAALQADTDDIQTRLPAGLNSGNITAHVVSIANNAITAASIATNAIDADALAADAVTEIGTGISVSAPTVDQIDTKLTAMHGSGAWGTATGFATPTDVDDSTATLVASIGALNNLSATQVWAAGTRTLTSGGAPTTTEIWSAATRTLTSPTPGSTTPPAISGTTLAIKKAVSFDVDVTGMTIPANWDKIYWTVKATTSVPDSEAVLQVVITNGGDAGDGLIYLNGADNAGHEDEASLTVDQPGGTITISITDDYTALVSGATPTLTSDFKAITDESKSVQLAVCPVSISSAVTLSVA